MVAVEKEYTFEGPEGRRVGAGSGRGVYGSLDELERDFGVRPDDLHRPFIDNLIPKNPASKSAAS